MRCASLSPARVSCYCADPPIITEERVLPGRWGNPAAGPREFSSDYVVIAPAFPADSQPSSHPELLEQHLYRLWWAPYHRTLAFDDDWPLDQNGILDQRRALSHEFRPERRSFVTR